MVGATGGWLGGTRVACAERLEVVDMEWSACVLGRDWVESVDLPTLV